MTSLELTLTEFRPDVYLLGRDAAPETVERLAAARGAQTHVLDGAHVFDRESLYAELETTLGCDLPLNDPHTVIDCITAFAPETPHVLLYHRAEVLARNRPAHFRRTLDLLGRMVRTSPAPLIVLLQGSNVSPVGEGVERLETPRAIGVTCGVLLAIFIVACVVLLARINGTI